MDDLKNEMTKIGELAKKAAGIIANTDADTKNSWLLAMADALDRNHGPILAANADDMARGREKGMSAAMLDRLELTPERIGIASGNAAFKGDRHWDLPHKVLIWPGS